MIGKLQDVVAASIVIGAPSSAEASAPVADAPDKVAAAAKPAEGQAAALSAKPKNAVQPDEKAAAEQKAAEQMDEESVARMTDELNELMQKIDCSLEFSYSKEVDMLSVKMTDSNTGEVLKEYPPEDLIQSMINAREWIGAFIDRNA